MDSLRKNKQEYNAKAQAWEDAMPTNVGHKYLEKPAMDSELPESFSAQSVLCIGVGSGGELTEILKRNPARVVGIDISEELMKIAASKHPSVEFRKMDMSAMDFPDATFDFVYSSLAFHYAPDWDVLFKEVGRVLKPGGVVLFSTDNPSYWGSKPKTGEYTNLRGITLTEHTAVIPGDIVITYYNHPSQASIKEALEHAGFTVQSFFNPSVISSEAEGQEREW
jgi:ubiquinone/menaquinone biosynthesis C-methylase UbiE